MSIGQLPTPNCPTPNTKRDCLAVGNWELGCGVTRAARPRRASASVYRRDRGKSARKWPPRLSSRRRAARAISKPTVTRLATRRQSRSAGAAARLAGRGDPPRSQLGNGGAQPFGGADETGVPPHQVANHGRIGHHPVCCRRAAAGASSIGSPSGCGERRQHASVRASPPPRARRTRGPRAASCWPAGWRRARRCTPPRRRRTVARPTCARRDRSRRRPSRNARPG